MLATFLVHDWTHQTKKNVLGLLDKYMLEIEKQTVFHSVEYSIEVVSWTTNGKMWHRWEMSMARLRERKEKNTMRLVNYAKWLKVNSQPDGVICTAKRLFGFGATWWNWIPVEINQRQ